MESIQNSRTSLTCAEINNHFKAAADLKVKANVEMDQVMHDIKLIATTIDGCTIVAQSLMESIQNSRTSLTCAEINNHFKAAADLKVKANVEMNQVMHDVKLIVTTID